MWTSPPGNRTRGFSLFELLVVLVLMTLAAALILPSFSGGLKGLELDASGRDLVTLMRQARSRAIAEQKVFRAVLENGEEPDARSSCTLTDEYDEPFKKKDLPAGIQFKFEGNSSSRRVVSFYPTGRSSGSDFVLKSEGGREVDVEVDPVTGFARVIRPQPEDGG